MTEVRRHRRILYTRYNALVQRSKKEGLEWKFVNFEHFLDCLEEIVPEDYHPKLYRLKFKNVEKLGYGKENIVIKRLSSSSKSMREIVEESKEIISQVEGNKTNNLKCQVPNEKHCHNVQIVELSRRMQEGYYDLADLLCSVLLEN